MNTQKFYDMQNKLNFPSYKMKRENPELFKEQMEQYREEADKIENQFKKEAFEELGIENNPQREKLYELAYRQAHSGGYNDVVCAMEDFVELIR